MKVLALATKGPTICGGIVARSWKETNFTGLAKRVSLMNESQLKMWLLINAVVPKFVKYYWMNPTVKYANVLQYVVASA